LIKYLKKFFLFFGIFSFFGIFLIFSQNTSIKLDQSIKITKKILGIGDDYSGFVANSFSDFYEIFIRGLKWKLSSKDYPALNIEISYENMKILDEQREKKIDNIFLANAKIRLDNNKKIKIKIRSKGDRDLHRENFANMSFKVDIKGEDRIFGLEEFAIQKPIIRNYGWEMLINQIASDEGLISPIIKPIQFSVNGENRGIYFVEENYNFESLERNKRKRGPIFSVAEEYGKEFPNVIYETTNNSKTSEDDLIRINHIYKKLSNIKNKNFELNAMFDLKLWAKFYAIIDIFGSYHGAVPKSVKLYFNPTTQLIEPVLYDNHLGGANYTNFSLIDFFSKDEFNYDICGFACTHTNWFKIFFKNENFVKEFIYQTKIMINNFEKNKYQKIIEEVEVFNDAMYSVVAPSDRVFVAGLLPYYMDLGHLSHRIDLIKKKLSVIEILIASNEKQQFDEHFFKSNFCNEIIEMNKCTDSYNNTIIFKKNFTLKNTNLKINDNEVLFLTGSTNIENLKITSKSGGMIVQIGGKIHIANVLFENLSNINLKLTDWSGAINIINSEMYLENVTFKNTKGEDALNTIFSNGSISSLTFINNESDAFDSDFSNFNFDSISCKNIGNDCFDTSGSNIIGKRIVGNNVGDKLLSVGEKSKLRVRNLECNKCGIGISVKDLSYLETDKIDFYETPLLLSVFNKKKIFGPAKLKLNDDYEKFKNENVLVGLKSSLIFKDKNIIGNEKDIELKEIQYGNIYGKSSK
jgi:hypothetical protein